MRTQEEAVWRVRVRMWTCSNLAMGAVGVAVSVLPRHAATSLSCCIRMLFDFSYRNHVCMAFPKYDMSLFDFMRENLFYPFSVGEIRSIGRQLLRALACTCAARVLGQGPAPPPPPPPHPVPSVA